MDLAKLSQSIQAGEGCRLNPYTDTTGHLTIGFGRNLSSNGISLDEARFLLSNDLQFAVRTAQTQPWWSVVKDDDVRSRALTEIGYNIGFRALAGFHKALDAALRRDWPACAAALLDSLWARQVGARAERLAAMILTGTDAES